MKKLAAIAFLSFILVVCSGEASAQVIPETLELSIYAGYYMGGSADGDMRLVQFRAFPNDFESETIETLGADHEDAPSFGVRIGWNFSEHHSVEAFFGYSRNEYISSGNMIPGNQVPGFRRPPRVGGENDLTDTDWTNWNTQAFNFFAPPGWWFQDEIDAGTMTEEERLALWRELLFTVIDMDGDVIEYNMYTYGVNYVWNITTTQVVPFFTAGFGGTTYDWIDFSFEDPGTDRPPNLGNGYDPEDWPSQSLTDHLRNVRFFGSGGFGAVESEVTFNLGVGIKYFINESSMIRFDLRDYIVDFEVMDHGNSEFPSNFEATIGYTYTFGQ